MKSHSCYWLALFPTTLSELQGHSPTASIASLFGCDVFARAELIVSSWLRYIGLVTLRPRFRVSRTLESKDQDQDLIQWWRYEKYTHTVILKSRLCTAWQCAVFSSDGCSVDTCNSDTIVTDGHKSASMPAEWVQSVANRDICWWALLMYQHLKLVAHESVALGMINLCYH